MRTLKEIIERVETAADDVTETEKAIAAAWWAGRDAGWRACSNRVRESVDAEDRTRYRHVTGRFVDAVYAATEKGDESAEILSWDYSL